MPLKQFYGKTVRIVAVNEKSFEGKVTDYFYPEDNESGKESIAIRDKFTGNLIEFPEEDIKSIDILEKSDES